MSALDDAVAELEAKRAHEDAERRRRCNVAAAFLKEFYERHIAPSQALKRSGVETAFDGQRILLHKPQEGLYAEGMAIVIGEQGEIDVSGRSFGPVDAVGTDTKRNELIAEIISHFSL